jgi:NAD(P)-dependent dehydrogenase (short-subunit alcohol dehydrogenase family)
VDGGTGEEAPDDSKINRLFATVTEPMAPEMFKPFECARMIVVTGSQKGWLTKTAKKLEERNIALVTIRGDEVAGMEQQELARLLDGCDTIVYAAHKELAESGPDGKALETMLEREVTQLYAVFRKLQPILKERSLRLLLPISQDGRFGTASGSERVLGSFPAGFVRSLRFELPGCKVQLVDAGDVPWEKAIERMVDTVSEHFEIGLSPLGRVKPAVAYVTGIAGRTKPLAEGDLVLVTGGARGIVFECVLALAKETGCSLLLTGRTTLPEGRPEWLSAGADTIDASMRQLEIDLVKKAKLSIGQARKEARKARSQWELAGNLARLKAEGVKAAYELCDVSDPEQLTALVAKVATRKRPIRGIVHGAGVQRSHLLAELTDEEIFSTVRTKVTPVLTLLDCLDWEVLKLFVSFGSITALFGNAGQTDYAMANDLLVGAGRAIKQMHPHILAQTIEWTAWRGTGMVSDQEARRFEEAGLVPIDVARGTQLFLDGVMGTDRCQLAAFNAKAGFAAGRSFVEHSLSAKPIARLVSASAGEGRNRAIFHPSTDIYIPQHKVNLEPVVPGTFVTEIFAEAVLEKGLALEEVRFRRPLRVLNEGMSVEVVKQEDGQLLLLPTVRPDLPPKGLANLAFATARLGRAVGMAADGMICPEKVLKALRSASYEAVAPFYTKLDSQFSKALKTGPIYRGIRATMEKDKLFYALVELTPEARALLETPGHFVLNPVLADMAVQVACAWSMQALDVMAIPFEFGHVHVGEAKTDCEAVVICRAMEMNREQTLEDVAVRSLDGRLIFSFNRVTLKTIADMLEKR